MYVRVMLAAVTSYHDTLVVGSFVDDLWVRE